MKVHTKYPTAIPVIFVGFVIAVFFTGTAAPVHAKSVRLWEKVEITLGSQNSYKNPYTEVEVWVDLKGPGFKKRCYGFWDGGKTFRIRVLANAPGTWTWKSGSSASDPGLAGKTGGFSR